MSSLRLSTVGAWCAIAAVACFVLGGVAMGASGVADLIPETGAEGRRWIADVDDAGAAFYGGAWLVILVGFLGMVALLGFYDVLRGAGQIVLLAPVLGGAGLTLVQLSHLIPIAMAYEIVPAYVAAGPGGRASLGATADTFAATALLTNTAGNFLGWGIAIPLFAWAIFETRALPLWIGWLGLFVGAVAGWLGLLSPASSVIEGITTLGFLGFFVFMVSMGVAILRRPVGAPAQQV